MKIIEKEELYIRQNDLTETVFTEDSVFFDIETTGFSPSNSGVYLIGCMYRQNQSLIIRQYFAQSPEEEILILKEFLNLAENFKTLISFNGTGFDLPFIKAKCDRHHIQEHFNDYQMLDIFKIIGKIKFLLKLENYKQKNIEKFLDIHRDDLYSGGELIHVYEDYTKTSDAEAEKLLLLHNLEDITGMLDLIPILTYTYTLNGSYKITSAEIAPYTSYEGKKGHEFILTMANDYPVPKRVSHQKNGIYVTMNKDITKLRVPVFEGELRYFYPNYKDYYYLPAEDMAMHKSVAEFVDKEYRERAKAGNCYTRKTGRFLPQQSAVMQPLFLQTHKDKTSYFELTEDFMNSDIMLRRYAEHLFTCLY